MKKKKKKNIKNKRCRGIEFSGSYYKNYKFVLQLESSECLFSNPKIKPAKNALMHGLCASKENDILINK